jgi:hypothetical protein
MPSLYHLVNYLANDFFSDALTTFIPPASWRVFSGIFYKVSGIFTNGDIKTR